MKNLVIKQIGIKDLIVYQKIGRQTFHETFAEANSEENMNTYLEDTFSIDKLSAEFKKPNAACYFAYHDNTLVAYLKLNISEVQNEVKKNKTLEIERIYVLKAFQGKKIGQTLLDTAIQIAKTKNIDFIFLGVWEKNPKAIAFYQKNGFMVFDQHIFTLGKDKQIDLLMKLQIQ